MNRLVALTFAGLCLVSTAQAQDIPQETTPRQDGRLLWIEPLGTTLGFAYTGMLQPSDYYSDERLYVLSGGYAHPLDARRSLATELFVMHFAGTCRWESGSCYANTVVRASIGLAYSFGGSPGHGFLLQPRLILGYYNEYPSDQVPGEVSPAQLIPGAHGFSLQAGLDVGYQWRFGPLYLAIVGGLAAGVGSGIANLPPLPFLIADDVASQTRQNKLTPALNLNLQLLRAGFSF